jgi:hypothetical protein
MFAPSQCSLSQGTNASVSFLNHIDDRYSHARAYSCIADANTKCYISQFSLQRALDIRLLSHLRLGVTDT